PAAFRANAGIKLPAGLTEPELIAHVQALAARNSDGAGPAVFLGGGVYPHWIPTAVDQILLRSEFLTAYTPYQPEVSQGTLQATFVLQSFYALLIILEYTNVSWYDGRLVPTVSVCVPSR